MARRCLTSLSPVRTATWTPRLPLSRTTARKRVSRRSSRSCRSRRRGGWRCAIRAYTSSTSAHGRTISTAPRTSRRLPAGATAASATTSTSSASSFRTRASCRSRWRTTPSLSVSGATMSRSFTRTAPAPGASWATRRSCSVCWAPAGSARAVCSTGSGWWRSVSASVAATR